jgi:hypothetical protein
MMGRRGRTILEDKNGNAISCEPFISQALLQKGLKVKTGTDGNSHEYRVQEWYYEAINEQQDTLHIVLKEIPKPRFERLDKDIQEFIQFLIVLGLYLVLGTIVFIGYTATQHPEHFWGFIGYYLRLVVLFAILIVGLTIAGTTKGYVKDKTFIGQVKGLTYSLLTLAAMALWWWYVSPPPSPLVTYPDDYAEYSRYIGHRFVDNIIMPVISIGWLGGLIKLLGWAGPASILERFSFGLSPSVLKNRPELGQSRNTSS